MSFVCSVCGETHEGLPAFTYDCPTPWFWLSDEEQAQGKCDSNFCRSPRGDHFIRCVLVLPLIGGPDPTFELGVWSSLSELNFYRYVETFNDSDQSKLGWMFGYLSNDVKAFPDSLSLKVHVLPQDDRQRPLLELEPINHPLAVAQRDGIAFETVLKIIHSD